MRGGDVAGVHGCKGKFAFVGRLVTCRRVGCIFQALSDAITLES